jgi:DNA-3-methyladenine glycosylase
MIRFQLAGRNDTAMMLSRKFYKRKTLKVAKDLLGCFLIRKIGRKIIQGIITETEAYIGEKDLACHAAKGRTKRTEIMYGEAGHAYIYMIYGMYYCLNVVTERVDYPAAVLIRGVKPFVTFRAKGYIDKELLNNLVLNGPGKVCRCFKINRNLNGWDLAKGEKLWIEPGIKIKLSQVNKSKRIGIDYAQHSRHYLWRYYLEP